MDEVLFDVKALDEIARLNRKIDQLETELASLKTAFGETFQRRSSVA